MPWRVLLMVAAGCGSSEPGVQMHIDAAPPIDMGCPVAVCDPLVQSGCNIGQRCTWIVDAAAAGGGRTACLPTGAVGAELPCMRDPNGGDNCALGTTCHLDKCRSICRPGGGQPGCGTGLTCKTAALFTHCGGTASAGVCTP